MNVVVNDLGYYTGNIRLLTIIINFFGLQVMVIFCQMDSVLLDIIVLVVRTPHPIRTWSAGLAITVQPAAPYLYSVKTVLTNSKLDKLSVMSAPQDSTVIQEMVSSAIFTATAMT